MTSRGPAALLVPLLLPLVIPAAAADTAEVIIGDIAYAPTRIDVRTGDTVKFVNRDFIDHTATEEGGGSFDLQITAQGSAAMVMRDVGTFRYICRYHPNMRGEIRVTGP